VTAMMMRGMVRASSAGTCLITLGAVLTGFACGDASRTLITPEVRTCAQSDDCSTVRPVCDLATARCRGCARDAECGDVLFCDVASGKCVECLTGDDCFDPFRPLCNQAGHRCVECVIDAHCSAADETCNNVAGTCTIPCVTADQCWFALPICDASIALCVECVTDKDCADTPWPYCRLSTCVF
jgi:hypothetical protein